MKNPRLLLIAMLILPWLSLPLLGAKSFKKFAPAAIFINVIMALESILAQKRVWWWVFKRLSPGWKGETPFIWGPFFVGSLWIMKLTYGHFARYLFANAVVDSSFAFLMMTWLKRLGIATLVRMEKFQLFLLFIGNAVLLYGFQSFTDRLRRKKYI